MVCVKEFYLLLILCYLLLVSGQTLDVFLHEEAVYGLSADPVNDNVFASACDDGRILIYDTRGPASTGESLGTPF